MDAKIQEVNKFRDHQHLFIDRFEAGETLSMILLPEYEKTKSEKPYCYSNQPFQRGFDKGG
jgi:hypothetical protein